MDPSRAGRVLTMFEARGEVEALVGTGSSAAQSCLDRAAEREAAATLLFDSGHWDTAFTMAYDAYRMAADAVVLALGYRVPAVRGAHRITFDIAHAAIGHESDAFAAGVAGRFRTERHALEYFDPERPKEMSEADARWALERAQAALDAAAAAGGT